MKEFIELVNKVLDGNYFEVKSYITPRGDDEHFNKEYHVDVKYIPDGSFAQRIKFTYKDIISAEKIKDIEYNSKEWFLRNIMFSKEANGNCIDLKFGTPIKMFADYKKQILELNKNKINE